MCMKSVQNKNDIDHTIEIDQRYKRTNLSNMINSMNDTTLIIKDTKKEAARPDEEINAFINNNLESIRFAYNKRMDEIGYFDGTVKVEFKINSQGDVISYKILKSSISDTTFLNELKKRVLKLNFGPIEIENDTINVVFPFVFLGQ